MPSNQSKTRTITSFFSSSKSEKQKTHDQEPNASPTYTNRAATTELIPPESLNVSSTVDSSNTEHVAAIDMYNHSISALLS